MQLAVSKTSDTLDLYNRVIGMDVCSGNGCVGAAAAAFQSECGVDKHRYGCAAPPKVFPATRLLCEGPVAIRIAVVYVPMHRTLTAVTYCPRCTMPDASLCRYPIEQPQRNFQDTF